MPDAELERMDSRRIHFAAAGREANSGRRSGQSRCALDGGSAKSGVLETRSRVERTGLDDCCARTSTRVHNEEWRHRRTERIQRIRRSTLRGSKAENRSGINYLFGTRASSPGLDSP